MSTTEPIKKRIGKLKKQFDSLKKGRESLLVMIDEAEIVESVYNSNAIENSTLSLKETEKILLEMEVSRNVSLREVFEAKNLARVMQYIRGKNELEELSQEFILLLHKMLMLNINDEIAGRFRKKGEYVRVGPHIAPPPENIKRMMKVIIVDFTSDLESFFSDKIALFHLNFEHLHPFIDGNGRMGRSIINYQLIDLGFPPIIIRNKGKNYYYKALMNYDDNQNPKAMEKIISLAVTESLYKRVTYLKGKKVVTLASYIRKNKKSAPAVLNAARRQNIPAFRENGVWKIGVTV